MRSIDKSRVGDLMRLALWQNTRPLTQRQDTDFQSANRRPVGWRGRYQEAVSPPPGISVWVIPEPPEPVVVPVRRVYFVINNVTLHRLPDGLPVPVFNLSPSLDAASWTWGFEALLPAAAESLVAPGSNGGPVELVASANGTTFRVLAERISRERVFGKPRHIGCEWVSIWD